MRVLFVYGTLKRGERNHHFLQREEFLREAVTAALYRLADLGAYPGLIEDATAEQGVIGELWRVSDATMARLDRLEGAPILYRLAPIRVDGESNAFAYFYNQAIPVNARTGFVWPLPEPSADV